MVSFIYIYVEVLYYYISISARLDKIPNVCKANVCFIYVDVISTTPDSVPSLLSLLISLLASDVMVSFLALGITHQ
jgi:hypothetical protein